VLPTQPINRLLRAAGLEVRRKPPILIRSPHELQLTFAFAAAHLFAHTRPQQLTVVQIGAFDGHSNDPVRELLEDFGWRGVLVEPQPGPYAELHALHAENSNVRVFNVAVDARDGVRNLYTVCPTKDLPGFVRQVASFDRSRVESASRYVPDGEVLLSRITPTPVETVTFDTLLERASVEQVDVLQIDAEGYDLELLRLFDAPRRLPMLINYEHEHLSRPARREAADLLIAAGYKLAMTFGGGDTLAYRTSGL
jgi:FkbM family methyltransferase